MPAFTAYYPLLLACLLLGLGLLVAAWRRPNRRRRALRLLASALAAGALWLTAYPPARLVANRRRAAILLTPGYQPDTLQALRRQLGAATPVWAYQLPAPLPAGVRALGSLLGLAEQRPALRELHVLGQGLPPADLPLLGAVPVQAHAAAFEGFAAAYWPRQLVLGQLLRLEGRVQLQHAGPAWVSISGSSDSVQVPAGGGAFRVRYQPRVAGRLLPTLLLRQAGRVLAAEPLPVEVREPTRPPVLLLAGAPGFEFKFLKNQLAATGRAVALRTPVSRGLVQAEALNQPAPALDHLTPALLARYPLAVADAAALAALPAAESQAVQAAVRAGRLGLVVLAGPGPLPAGVPGRGAFVVQPTAGSAAAPPQPLSWPEGPAGLKAALPAHLQASAAQHPLVAGAGQPVALAHRLGLGQVVASVVPETFRWVLQGQAAAYAAYWNHLLAAAQPAPTPPASWQLTEAWPRRGQPLTLQLAASQLPAATAALRVQPLAGGAGARLALAQDPRLPEWSTAPYWPAGAGWHEVQGPGAVRYAFFVFDSAAWRGPALAAWQQAQLGARRPLAAANYLRRERWPAGWFFGLFVLAAGFLWLEEKL